jgi:uncharacterized membrane protein
LAQPIDARSTPAQVPFVYHSVAIVVEAVTNLLNDASTISTYLSLARSIETGTVGAKVSFIHHSIPVVVNSVAEFILMACMSSLTTSLSGLTTGLSASLILSRDTFTGFSTSSQGQHVVGAS